MISIVAGLLAAVVSFGFNRYVVEKVGNDAITYLIPLCEEMLKTGFYYFIGGNLIIVHLFFGIIEASFDLLNSKVAAVLAVVTHLAFGGLTFYCWELTTNLILSLMIVIVIHSFWNYLVRRLVRCD